MKKQAALLAIAGFYFCYFAFNGLFSPFWGLYLAGLAFPAWQIGILTSLTQINRIYAPALWGYLADRTGKRQLILRVAGVFGLLFFIPLLITKTFWPIFIAVLLGSFFWSAALPLVEATAMSLLKGDSGAYSRLRIWGSLGFVAATVAAGYLIEAQGVTIFPVAVISVMAGLALYCWWVPEAPAVQAQQAVETRFLDILRRREVQSLLLACFLMALAHGPYYSFYSIYVANQGYSKSTIGWFWTLGVVAEIAIFWLMPRLNLRFSHKALLLFGFAIAALRFSIIAWGISSLLLLLLAQLAHAFTFGSNHAVNMAYIHRYFAGRHQAKGQALYIAMSFGIGGSLGGIIAGMLWQQIGGAWVFSLAALACACAYAIAWRGLPKA
ncbi:MFS transporter [Chitinibacter bivalviorum]|uniref:MFS transporter n=1 Tax=Chitinibacter bivalviorum TaxID=2739434 RepID=A0A7H9BHM5_9NEIS|nr:MFS transporter [Chitinibacter bivalviorum]QLG87708.1 MFS transporter [Chitinibacter bivalviorum]